MNRIRQEIAASSLGAITTDEAGVIEGRYLFNKSFGGFDGHFPGHPILPAIVEISTAVSLIGEHLGAGQRLIAVEDAKFLNPVEPEQELLVRCRTRAMRGKLLWDAQLSVEGTVTASMLIELEPAEKEQ